MNLKGKMISIGKERKKTLDYAAINASLVSSQKTKKKVKADAAQYS